MQYFDFSGLIGKYCVPFTVVSKSSGSYVSGQWQEGAETETPLTGAILPLPERKIYQPGGTYTAQDRYLYTLEPIADALRGGSVRYGGREYQIEEDRDNGQEQFTGVSVYLLKWVRNFDQH